MNDDVKAPILIGTVHRDREGETKLQRLLEEIGPEIITLEMSAYACRYRQAQGSAQLLRLDRILHRLSRETERSEEELAAHPTVIDIRTLLALPFEYRAASLYAQGRDIPLHLIDLSNVSAVKLRRVETELITYKNLKILTALPENHRPAAEEEGYATARALIFGGCRSEVRQSYLERRRGDEGVGPRDAWMATELRRRVETSRGRRVVHIGGWIHLLEDEKRETLYSRLEDLHPVRMLLE